MAIKSPKEFFVHKLSVVWHGTQRSVQFFEEMSKSVQQPEIRDALSARAFIASSDISKLDQCFKLLGEKPVEPNTKMQEMLVEDYRRELGGIESPVGKILFTLSMVNHLTHLRIAGLETLVALADRSGNFGVGVLIESVLADKIAFIERNRRFLRRFAEEKIADRLAA